MSKIELKIPPPMVAVACAAVGWWLTELVPVLSFHWPWRLAAAAVLFVLGLSLEMGSLIAFLRVGTTVNPWTPEATRFVVLGGPYRFSRNPMYLGLTCMLAAYCVYLAHFLVLLMPVAFFLYIHFFQVLPEERILLAKFGPPYAAYLNRVRRWL